MLADWQLDPAELAKADEALSCLSILRRRFAIRLVETGHQRRAVYEAGYHPSTPASATAIAQENLASPAVQHALQALLEARGLSARKLDEIHAVHLSRHSSPDGGDRDRSLRAVALARKYVQPKGAVTAPGSVADQVFDQMTSSELDDFAKTCQWPERFKDVLTGQAAISDQRVRHHHGRQEPQRTAEDAATAAAVNSHARHPPREPTPASQSADTADPTPPARPAPSSPPGTRDYVGAAPSTATGQDRLYDPQATSTTAQPINARFAVDYERARVEIGRDEQVLREGRRFADGDPRLAELANRDRRW
jgi:hypothetical protein